MRFARTYVLAFFSLLLAFPVFTQEPSTSTTESSPQALALLQKSLAALTGGQSITDVTLSGTARRIAGSDDESGEATYKAVVGTGSRIDLTVASGSRSEIHSCGRPLASTNTMLALRPHNLTRSSFKWNLRFDLSTSVS